jgi:hypothetical protein
MLGTIYGVTYSGSDYGAVSSLGIIGRKRHPQITAASLVPREEITAGKLGKACLGLEMSRNTWKTQNNIRHSDEGVRLYLFPSKVVHTVRFRRETHEFEDDD